MPLSIHDISNSTFLNFLQCTIFFADLTYIAVENKTTWYDIKTVFVYKDIRKTVISYVQFSITVPKVKHNVLN